MSIARLHFECKHMKTLKQIRAGNMPILVHIPKDLKALDVRLKQPPRSASSNPSCGSTNLRIDANTMKFPSRAWDVVESDGHPIDGQE